MYRPYRLASAASVLLVVLLILVFALGSSAPVTAEEGAAAVESTVSKIPPPSRPDVVRELTEKRTENSRTYLLKDGRLLAEVYSGPIQFKDEKGDWKEIDTSLIPGEDGSYVSAATPVRVTLSAAADGVPVVSLDYQGAAVELIMKDQVFASPTVDGDTLSYAAAEPGAETATTETSVGPEETSTTTAAATTTTAVPTTAVPTTDTTAIPAETTTESTPGPTNSAEGAGDSVETTTGTTSAPVEEIPSTDTTSVPAETTTETTSLPLEPSTTETTAGPAPETTTTTEPAKTPEVTLSYQVLGNGVKETIALASPAAPDSFTFVVRHPGLTLWQDNTGRWGFYEMIEYPPVLVLGGLTVLDSSRDDADNPAFCPDATMAVLPGQEESTITITVPRTWMEDPARVFPVMIDPSVYTATASADTYVASNPGGSSFGTLTYMSVGYSSQVWYRSFVKFDLSGLTDFPGSDVFMANLQLHQNWQSTGVAKMMHVAQMTKTWSESSTWNGLGTYALPYSQEQMVGTGAQYVWFDFPEVAQQWADGGPNEGFCIYVEPTQMDHVRKFDTRQCSTDAYRPKLSLEYSPALDVTAPPYNANGTDLLDDTAQIQAAINAAEDTGGIVKVPAGDYYVSGLYIDRCNLVLKGTGTSSVLLPLASTQDHMIRIGGSDPSYSVQNITVSDLYVRVPADGDGIQVVGEGGGTDITLERLSMGGGADRSDHEAISCTDTFSQVIVKDNDLSSVTALALDLSEDISSLTVCGNTMPYQPYQAEFFSDSDGYQAAVLMAKDAFPETLDEGSGLVIVPADSATGAAVALTAAPLAKAYGGPVLLTPSTALHSAVAAELSRLQPTTVFVIGLSNTVKDQVIHALPSASVTQIYALNDYGIDVYATAAQVATALRTKLGVGSVEKAVVYGFAKDGNGQPTDASFGYAVPPVAAKMGWAVLPAPRSGLLPDTAQTLYANLSLKSAVEVGTTVDIPLVSPATRTQIGDASTTAYYLAQLVAYFATDPAQGLSFAHTGLASAQSYPDSLAMGAYAATDAGVLLLTSGATIPLDTEGVMDENYPALDRLSYTGQPTLWKEAENSRVWVPGAIRHTTYDLGSFAGHSATATLDKWRLDVATADLEVASFGPRAALDRIYLSFRPPEYTQPVYFAPGWRFSFQRCLVLGQQASGRIDYLDEAGETYIFLKNGSQWVPQPGLRAGLRAEGSTWKLTAFGGNTLTFDASGRLTSEADPNGNTVTYVWAGSILDRIRAANLQEIDLTWSGTTLTQAAYTTDGKTRTVTYQTASPWTVTHSFSGSPATASRSLSYAYQGTSALVGITANDYVGTTESTLAFDYVSVEAGTVDEVRYPEYHPTTNPNAKATIGYGESSATVTTYGQIYFSGDIDGTPGTAITQTFTWNPSGTMASRTNPKTSSETTQTWTYAYADPYTNLVTAVTPPIGPVTRYTYNNRGNMTTETLDFAPGSGLADRTTTYTYPDSDPGIPGMIDVAVSADADDGYNANTTLHLTSYYYQAVGQGSANDKAGWRFLNVKVPAGATITYAQLWVCAYDSPTGSISNLNTELGLEAVANPGIWKTTSPAHEPRLATMTTAKVTNWRPTTDEWKAGKWVGSPDLSASVQEVVNLGGWQSGNAMAVLWRNTTTPATNLLNIFDKKSGAGAHLIIYYTRNLNPDPTRDLPKEVTAPNDRVTQTFSDAKGNLTKVRTQLNDTEWAETRYTYADVSAQGVTFKGAMTQEKKLISGTPEAGTWAITDFNLGGYSLSGEPLQAVYQDVLLQDQGTAYDLTVTRTFDGFGNLLTKTDTAGQTTETNAYDLAGRLLTATGPVFTATVGSAVTAQVTTHHLYDPWGHETSSYSSSSADPGTQADWTSVTTFNLSGRPNGIRRWLSGGTTESTTTYAYDTLGRLISSNNNTVSGLPALTSYDARGNVVASWVEGACTGTYDLLKAARVVNTDGTPAYDALGRKTRALAAGDTYAATYLYFDDGRVQQETKPDGTWTQFTYDEVGNVTATLLSTTATTSATYDLGGRCETSTNANGFVTSFTYDLLGRCTHARAGAQGQPDSDYTYNALGWKLKIVDADGFTSSYVFDAAGRTITETTAGYATTYLYQSPAGGGVGLLWKKTEGTSDRQAIYTYDYFGRTITDLQTSGGVTVKNASATYDSLGRVTGSSDSVRYLTHDFTYPVNTTNPTLDNYAVGSITTLLTIGADQLEVGRVSTIPDIPVVTRSISARDNAKRVTQATLDTNADQTPDLWAQYTYDQAGRIQKQWGTTGGGSGYALAAQSTTAYTYHAVSGLKTADDLRLASVGSAATIYSTYTYNTAGRLITAATNGNPSESFTYDATGNIQTAGSTTFLYETVNGVTLLHNSTGGYARYYFFNPDDKWRTVQAPTDNQSDLNREQFAYTGTGRLQTYTKYTSGSISLQGAYTYDAQGQRTKSVVGPPVGLITTTEYAYSGLLLQSLSASQVGTGATTWKITYLYDEYGRPYGGVYRSPATSASPVFFGMVLTDRGDVVELLDAAGNPFAAYRYDAWGNPQGLGTDNDGSGLWYQTTTLITSSTLAKAIAQRQPLRYASYCYDSESGMYYLSSRHYDPKTRQFLSKDLSRNDGEQSAYQYCLGNPIANVDPTGYKPADPEWFKWWVQKQKEQAKIRAAWNRYLNALKNIYAPKPTRTARVYYYGWAQALEPLANRASSAGKGHPSEDPAVAGRFSASVQLEDRYTGMNVRTWGVNLSWASDGKHVSDVQVGDLWAKATFRSGTPTLTWREPMRGADENGNGYAEPAIIPRGQYGSAAGRLTAVWDFSLYSTGWIDVTTYTVRIVVHPNYVSVGELEAEREVGNESWKHYHIEPPGPSLLP